MATNTQRAAAATTNDRVSPARARRRLRPALDRETAYWLLTATILLAYAALAVGLRAALPNDLPYAIALLATGAGALVALSLRDRLQAAADRLMFGDRDDPHRALARLGAQLEKSIEPSAVPLAVVETVAAALRLPYVAIEPHDGLEPPAAVHGQRPPDLAPEELLRLPLVHRGAPVGWLVLAPRSHGHRFDDADMRLLAELAHQAGPAIEAARLTADLQRSRLRLVTAREEERRRLRRDLHDGLAPMLAGTLLKVEAARGTLAGRPDDAARIIAELASGTRRAIDEVRRVTHDLRPPALDELGLIGALREQAAAFAVAAAGPTIEIHVPPSMPALPAAVEVAAYRIGLEALTNVMRHSGAARASITFAVDGEFLVIEMVDDGRGVGAAPAGVGLRSMRERAEELGGTLEIAPASGAGTLVRASLPLHEPS